MTSSIDFAEQLLLSPVDLHTQQLEQVVGRAMSTTVDRADVYLQSTQSEDWFLEDGIVKEGGFNIDRGFGLRVISGEKTGFAYADNISLLELEKAASSARGIAQAGQSGEMRVSKKTQAPSLYPDINPLQSIDDTQKVTLLREMDAQARALDARVKQVMIRLSASHDVMMVMDSDGTMAADVRPLVSVSIRVIVQENGRTESGSAGGGAREGYAFFLTDNRAKSFVEKAVKQAVTNLSAVPAPAGLMPVVLGPGWPAVLLHEAVGHGLEGDFNRKGSSAFSGRLGETVASSLCTIVDDGTIAGRRGSLTVDDEGTPSQNTVLIEKGVLKNYLQDKHNAALMNMTPTGNGRRESYATLPIPRMTNTYMLPGEHDPDAIIASVEQGIYAADFSGGQVDITSGKFVFTASEAYRIENGKITQPIKGASLVGNGPDILTKVSMVGHDLALDQGLGTCGKAGQTVPVGVGQPTLKIDEMTVGGSGG